MFLFSKGALGETLSRLHCIANIAFGLSKIEYLSFTLLNSMAAPLLA
jgi:hypothetical protein